MINKEIEEQIQYTFKYGTDLQKFCLFLCLAYIANNKGEIDMSNKIPDSKKYVKVSDVKKKIRYVAKQYGTSDRVSGTLIRHIDKIPFFLESEIETTLTSNRGEEDETN